MMSAKADCEALMNAALPFAMKMLREKGEFFPYGGVMRPSDDIVDVAGYDGREQPPSLDIIRLIKSAFVEGANDGSYKATALVYDVRVSMPDVSQTTDAIAVSLNHRDGYSVRVMFPYTISGMEVVFDESFAQTGEKDIFPAQ
jgi:hypothetical protein